MKKIYVLLLLLNLIYIPIFCMNPETTDLSTIIISDLKSLQSIAQELSNPIDDTLACYIIQPACMAAYTRHRANLETTPTKREIDFFVQHENTEYYKQLTKDVLREAHSGKIKMINPWNGVMHFYAKKEDDRRVELIYKFVETTTQLTCRVVMAIAIT